MNKTIPSCVPAAAAAALLAWCWSSAALAHCGAGETCVASPCHHGPTPECLQSQGGGRVAERIASPQVQEAVKEVIIPKVPQFNLPINPPKTAPGGKRPANLPAPAGEAPAQVPLAHDTRALPPALPPSAIAREAAPQVFTGIISVTRDIEHERALDDLRKKDPRLADSQWLTDHRTVKLGESYKELERIDKATHGYIEHIDPAGPYSDLRESLSRASKTLQMFGAGEQPKEKE